jgi:RNase P/RNase MRP subunit p29
MKLVKALVMTVVLVSLVLTSVAFAATKSTVKRFTLTGNVVAIGPGDTFKVKVRSYSISLKGYIGKDRELAIQVSKDTKLFLATLERSKNRTILKKDKTVEFSTLKDKDQVIVKGTIVAGTPNTFVATEIDILTKK